MYRFKVLRIQAGYSQKQVADLLGVSRSTYEHYENETRELNFSQAVQLAHIFNCDLNSLVEDSSVIQ